MAPLRRCLAVAMIAAVLATQTAAAATASPSSSPRPLGGAGGHAARRELQQDEPPQANDTPTPCAAPTTRHCTACDACCEDLDHETCAGCMASLCDPPHQCATDCNVCFSCCKPFLTAQEECDACFETVCAPALASLFEDECENHGTDQHPVTCSAGCISGNCWMAPFSSPCVYACLTDPTVLLFGVLIPFFGRSGCEFLYDYLRETFCQDDESATKERNGSRSKRRDQPDERWEIGERIWVRDSLLVPWQRGQVEDIAFKLGEIIKGRDAILSNRDEDERWEDEGTRSASSIVPKDSRSAEDLREITKDRRIYRVVDRAGASATWSFDYGFYPLRDDNAVRVKFVRFRGIITRLKTESYTIDVYAIGTADSSILAEIGAGRRLQLSYEELKQFDADLRLKRTTHRAPSKKIKDMQSWLDSRPNFPDFPPPPKGSGTKTFHEARDEFELTERLQLMELWLQSRIDFANPPEETRKVIVDAERGLAEEPYSMREKQIDDFCFKWGYKIWVNGNSLHNKDLRRYGEDPYDDNMQTLFPKFSNDAKLWRVEPMVCPIEGRLSGDREYDGDTLVEQKWGQSEEEQEPLEWDHMSKKAPRFTMANLCSPSWDQAAAGKSPQRRTTGHSAARTQEAQQS
jgi:hypothetical protein